MKAAEIVRARLRNQLLARPQLDDPAAVVAWLGAVQAQDFAGALWALGLRLRRPTVAAVERAFAEGRILRTHVLRPTWHFVTPRDIRWLLTLTAPRVKAAMAYQARQLGLTEKTFACSRRILERALAGGQERTRDELRQALRAGGITVDEPLQVSHLMMRAELDAVVCSGARRGKQHTYTLLAERAPEAIELDREAALAELVWRYFTGHGPATAADFAWWSGLTVADANRGLSAAGSRLERETVAGKPYWLGTGQRAAGRALRQAHLLPTYAEYRSAYQDRSAALPEAGPTARLAGRDVIFDSPIVVAGRVVGTWKRTIGRHGVKLALRPAVALAVTERRAVERAAQRYGRFLGAPVALTD
jgi:hypothetical protein